TKTINSEEYQSIFHECCLQTMESLYPNGWVLQQDNATPHTSGSTKKFLEKERIDSLDWPASSPDLNIVEHVWIWMKKQVKVMTPRTVDQWKRAIHDKWEEFPQEFIEKYLDGMPRRLQDCIASKGAKIKK